MQHTIFLNLTQAELLGPRAPLGSAGTLRADLALVRGVLVPELADGTCGTGLQPVRGVGSGQALGWNKYIKISLRLD